MKVLTPHEALPSTVTRAPESPEREVRRLLGRRSLVIVGLMGAGKTTVGRRLAQRLQLVFRDSDQEIETRSNMSIPDYFAIYGEPDFRSMERRVIARLLGEGPMVLATGGGAYMDAETRARVSEDAVSVWLRADLDTLMRRVRKRSNRPLRQTIAPEGTMRGLMEARHPTYALADLAVDSQEAPHDRVVQTVIAAVHGRLGAGEGP